MLGAALGAFAAPWLLLPAGGIPGAVCVAAVGNLLAGLGALVLARGRADGGAGPRPAPDAFREPRADPPLRPVARALRALGLRGALARDPVVPPGGVGVKSTAFTFGTVLGDLPARLGPGLPARGAPRRRACADRSRTFLLCQCAILLRLGRLGHAARALAARHAGLRVARRATGAPTASSASGTCAIPCRCSHLYVALPLFLFALPTLLMGFSFPVLQRAVHDELRTSGRKVGALQAANIAGCVAGSLLVGPGRARAAGDGRDAAAAGARGPRLRRRRLALRAAGASRSRRSRSCSLAASLPGSEELWRRLHGETRRENRALFEEDATGVVADARAARSGSGCW